MWRHGGTPGKGAEQEPFKYCEKNLQKSLGHVYRAGYDAFDILALNKIRQIDRYVDSYRVSTLHTVIADYAVRVRKIFEEAVQQCDGAKQGKDVEPESIDQHPVFFAEYKLSLEKFDSILNVFHTYDKDLIAVEEDASKNYHKQRNWALWGIAATIITALIAIILTILLSR